VFSPFNNYYDPVTSQEASFPSTDVNPLEYLQTVMLRSENPDVGEHDSAWTEIPPNR
jgi:hypothetical protein